MTLHDYRRIEEALSVAEDISEQRLPLTQEGKEIREEIRALLRKVTLARIRAEVAAESLSERPDSRRL